MSEQSYGWIGVEAGDVKASYPEAVAKIEREAIAAYLASPEAEKALTEAITSTANAVHPQPDREYEWWTTPSDFARAILAAWREQL